MNQIVCAVAAEACGETFEEACALVRAVVVDGARINFSRHGKIEPMSFVLCRRDPATGRPVPKPMLLVFPLRQFAHDKDGLRAVQQSLCDGLDALAHVYITEGWLAPGDEKMEALYAAGKGAEDHPERTEVVCAAMEHRDGSASWTLPIVRDGVTASLGEVREEMGEWEGRMSRYVKQPFRKPVVEA